MFLCNFIFAQSSVTDSLRSILKNSHAINEKIETYLALSKEYYNIDGDTSYQMLINAKQLSDRIDSDEYAGIILTYLGDHAIRNDSLEKAIILFKNAIIYLEDENEINTLIRVNLILGNIYIQRDNNPEAMSYYHQAIGISEESGIERFLPNLFNNLGIVHLNMKNYEQALELYSKALRMFERKGDSSNIAGTTANIGSIYTDLGEYDMAKTYYSNAYNIFKRINNEEGEAHALFKLGLVEIMQKQYDEAMEHLNQSLEIQENLDVTLAGSKSIFLSETLINKGIIFLKTGRIDKAITNLQTGLDLAIETGQLSLIALASQNLSDTYSQKNHPIKALNYYKIYKIYSDSLFNEENIRRITQLEMQYQFDSKLKEQKLNELKQKRQNLIYIIISGGLLFILILAILLLRLEKNKKRKVELEKQSLKSQLDFRNKELATYVLYNLKKSEFILNISEKLKKVKLQETSQNKKVIDEILREMKSSSKKDEWKEFEIRFQNVYTGFYKKLSSTFPDLTPNELRLCAFLRLNMTTKDISAITYQSYSSIDIARYRLRKKLDLEKDDNLITFLSKF